MADINNMSIEDLVRFAETGELPEGEVDPVSAALPEPKEEDFNDPNEVSAEELASLFQMEAPTTASADQSAPSDEELSGEATEAELLAMLGGTTASVDENAPDPKEIAKGIDKIKLRQLANQITMHAPEGLFSRKEDDSYYFLSALAGQMEERHIVNAKQKCAFISKCLGELSSFALSEADFTIDEFDAVKSLFSSFSEKIISDDQKRGRIDKVFKSGWKSSLSRIQRDIRYLQKYAPESYKPIWILVKFYESLSRSYALFRALLDLQGYQGQLDIAINKEEKFAIINHFDDLVAVAPVYGLKSLHGMKTRDALLMIEKFPLHHLISTLDKRRTRIL
ncbi:MAG: hypothetical protein HQL31_12070 [Planctomycetes bacterium]|nr:hypothetical protein [Planctomycetota bacterium]